MDEPRVANGMTVGDYLDYLFGRNDASEIRPLCKEGEQEEGQESCLGDMLK